MALPRTAKRTGALAVAVAVAALTLAGCSGGGGGGGAADTDAPVTLTFSVQVADPETNQPQLYAAIQAFEKANPTITIDLTGEPVADHLQKLQVAAQADTLPDIFWIYDANARDLQAAGRLLDIRPILEDADALQYYPDSTVSGFSAGDFLYGQPSSQLVTGRWYNKQILEENGLDVPVTFDDLLADAKVLSDAGVVTYSNGANQATFSCWGFLRDLSAFGWDEKVTGLLDGSVPYDNPDFAALYGHIAELADAGAFADNVSTTTYDQLVARFTSGDAAFLDGGVWMAGQIQSTLGDDAGFWIGPEYSDGVGDQQIAMSVPAAPYAYSAKAAQDPNKLAAMQKWIVFWAGQEASQLQVDGALPPSTTWPVTVPADQTVFSAALAASSASGNVFPVNQPDLMVPTPVATAMYDSIYGVIQQQLSPDDAMALVQAALDANR